MNFRPMKADDRNEVLKMMRAFYDSPAVLNKADDDILNRNFDNCIGDCPFVNGYIVEKDMNVAGYSMISKSYSTEYGCPCLWIEDLYFKPDYRGKGLGKFFFKEIESIFTECPIRFRLEVEPKNKPAVSLYNKMGFTLLPYNQMTKEIE